MKIKWSNPFILIFTVFLVVIILGSKDPTQSLVLVGIFFSIVYGLREIVDAINAVRDKLPPNQEAILSDLIKSKLLDEINELINYLAPGYDISSVDEEIIQRSVQRNYFDEKDMPKKMSFFNQYFGALSRIDAMEGTILSELSDKHLVASTYLHNCFKSMTNAPR